MTLVELLLQKNGDGNLSKTVAEAVLQVEELISDARTIAQPSCSTTVTAIATAHSTRDECTAQASRKRANQLQRGYQRSDS